MTASVALRAPCCDWHATRHGGAEHASCVDCAKPMPLVKTTFPGLPPMYICPRCSIALRVERSRGVAPAPEIPRFLRRQPMPRRAPEETFAVKP